MIFLLNVLLLAGAPSTEALTIAVVPAKTRLLAGEPLVLGMTFTGMSALYWDTLSRENTHLRILVDRGSGFVPYFPQKSFSTWSEGKKTILKDRRAESEVSLEYDANLGDWVFPAAGRYRVVVEYQESAVGLRVRSRAVTIEVAAPIGAEKTVHDAVRQLGPAFLASDTPGRLPAELVPLVEAFPRSVYLQGVRQADLEYRMHLASEAFDPDDPEAKRPANRTERVSAARRLLTDLLPLGRAVAEAEGQFQPDALLMLARLQAISGDDAARVETLRRIVREFPARAAADVARDQLSEEE